MMVVVKPPTSFRHAEEQLAVDLLPISVVSQPGQNTGEVILCKRDG